MMKVAIVGSRKLQIDDFSAYLPKNVEQIISGGAKGIDTCAAEYAKAHGIDLVEILPDYAGFGRAAPLRRNEVIVDLADLVLIFWDGSSRGTKHVIACCEKSGKQFQIYYRKEQP